MQLLDLFAFSLNVHGLILGQISVNIYIYIHIVNCPLGINKDF